MSLDGCLMTSPEQCGSVCAVRTHRHPVQIARLVMDLTPHIMLAGEGADDFANAHGLPEEPLLSENAKDAWEKRQAEEKGGTANVRPIDGDPDGGSSVMTRNVGETTTTRSVCWVWTRVDSWLVPVRPAACPGRCRTGR